MSYKLSGCARAAADREDCTVPTCSRKVTFDLYDTQLICLISRILPEAVSARLGTHPLPLNISADIIASHIQSVKEKWSSQNTSIELPIKSNPSNKISPTSE